MMVQRPGRHMTSQVQAKSSGHPPENILSALPKVPSQVTLKEVCCPLDGQSNTETTGGMRPLNDPGAKVGEDVFGCDALGIENWAWAGQVADETSGATAGPRGTQTRWCAHFRYGAVHIVWRVWM